MVGMKVGESREFQMILPDDFEPAALRGVDVTCTVGVSELFEYNMPEVLLAHNLVITLCSYSRLLSLVLPQNVACMPDSFAAHI